MAKNIIGNLITSTNTFNKAEKKCIDIVCKENLEEDVPDNWDDTMLRCTMAVNISNFKTTNIPAVSHYFIANNTQEYYNKPSSRCTTPVIPPDNNPVIVIHSCKTEKIEKEKQKPVYGRSQSPYKSPRTSVFIMGHINDKNRKRPTDDEQAAFQAFKQDFHHANQNMQAKMDKVKECQINEHKWPEKIKAQFQILKGRIERQLNLMESIQDEVQPSDYNAKINQMQMMDAIYHVIQEERIWQMDTSHTLKDLKWQYPIDNTISCCEAKIRRAEYEIKLMNKIINSYKQNVEHTDNSSQIINDVLENLALKIRIVKESAGKFFNLKKQLPSQEQIIPTEVDDSITQSDRMITDLQLQEKIKKLVKNVKEEDMKCY